MNFIIFVIFSILSTVMGSDMDHCFEHGIQGEMIRITCEFDKNTFIGGNCSTKRADPLFDITVKDQERSIVCYLNSTGRVQLSTQIGVGVCWCNETLSRSSSCTSLLNTTVLSKRQVTWKCCTQREIYLEAEKMTSTHATTVDETTKNNVKAVVGGVVPLVIVVTIGLLWRKHKRPREGRGPVDSTEAFLSACKN